MSFIKRNPLNNSYRKIELTVCFELSFKLSIKFNFYITGYKITLTMFVQNIWFDTVSENKLLLDIK